MLYVRLAFRTVGPGRSGNWYPPRSKTRRYDLSLPSSFFPTRFPLPAHPVVKRFPCANRVPAEISTERRNLCRTRFCRADLRECRAREVFSPARTSRNLLHDRQRQLAVPEIRVPNFQIPEASGTSPVLARLQDAVIVVASRRHLGRGRGRPQIAPLRRAVRFFFERQEAAII